MTEFTPPRTKYLHRPKAGILYFRANGLNIERLPADSSPEFAATYDRLLADLNAGKYGVRRPIGRPKGETRLPKGAHVYFIKSGDLVKIGFASSLSRRLSQLNGAAAIPPILLGIIRGTRDVEQFIHWQFRRYRRRGEWFAIEGKLADFIQEEFA